MPNIFEQNEQEPNESSDDARASKRTSVINIYPLYSEDGRKIGEVHILGIPIGEDVVIRPVFGNVSPIVSYFKLNRGD